MNLESFLISKSIQTKPIPWEDPSFSKRSLQLHLDQENDVNSRREFIIEKQVNWIHSFILKEKKSKILELACGPGLYLSKLAGLGHLCTGIDISPSAISYARDQAPSSCNYFCNDIMNLPVLEKYDMIFLNFGWFHTFKKKEVLPLLDKFPQILGRRGQILFELLPMEVIKKYGQEGPLWHKATSGIFSDESYLFLQENHWREKEKLAKLNYFILQANSKDIQAFHQYYQAYTHPEIEELLKTRGFKELQYFSQICEDDDFADELYYLACRKS
ncbi:MAG: class I SAM-dependent methyltransferase [Candidatus Marinimicrobia bacterium]|nr:class I SAM-dependent methyltransferase [Candidatus Neomarinimicrobiota bacterium]